jgi:polysaccharide chain length determinant protein (PEP-CTERM system associated)
MTGQKTGSERGASEFEALSLIGILALLRRRKLLVILPFVLTTATAVAFALYLPDVFEARALIDLDLPPSYANSYDPRMNAAGQLSAVRDAINRRSFLEPVIAEFDLYETTDGQVETRDLEEMRSRLRLSREGPLSFYMSFEDTDPERAAGVVSRVSNAFIEGNETATRSRAQDRVALIEEEVATVQGELDGLQQQIDDYKDGARGRIPENLNTLTSSLNRVTNDLQALNRQIAVAEAERAGYQAEIRMYEGMGFDEVAATPATRDARRTDLEQRLAAARDRYSDQHPTVIDLEAQLERLGPAPSATDGRGATGAGGGDLQPRYITLRASLERIDTQLDFYYEEKDRLVEESNEYQRQIDAIPVYDQELSALVREADNARSRYHDRLERLEEARLDARLMTTGGPVKFRLAEPARVPDVKSGPSRRRIVLMGALIGLALGFGLILVRHQLDSTFSDVDELRRFSHFPTLASIPQLPQPLLGRPGPSTVPTITDGVSVASEQYRILASRLQKMIDRECAQILLVTSSGGGEGKTTTATNTAIALSHIQSGKVLLIDADLRKPRVRASLREVHDGQFGTEDGFRQLLSSPNEMPPECFGKVGKLYVLASTDGRLDSLGDVTSESIRTAFARLRKKFKYIVIDSPPLLPIVDSHLLAELADRVILIVRAHQTRRETLARTLESFDVTKLLGFVMNGVDYAKARYGNVYHYYAKEYPQTEKKRSWRGAKLRILL